MQTAQTIQQLKGTQETLWHFLAALPASMEAQVFYGLLLTGAVGMIAHYMMRWLTDEIQGSLAKYLFIDYPKRTALAYAGIIGVALTSIASGVFVNDQGAFVGWLNVCWFGLTNGYAADSVANKGAKPPA